VLIAVNHRATAKPRCPARIQDMALNLEMALTHPATRYSGYKSKANLQFSARRRPVGGRMSPNVTRARAAIP